MSSHELLLYETMVKYIKLIQRDKMIEVQWHLNQGNLTTNEVVLLDIILK